MKSVITTWTYQRNFQKSSKDLKQWVNLTASSSNLTHSQEQSMHCTTFRYHYVETFKSYHECSHWEFSSVDQSTSWCAGMITVPKKNGTVCICVHLKMLNENVLREIHFLPKVDETALLSWATCFLKLDADSGFWQIPLSADAHLLTTFLTPYGWFCFNKLLYMW